MYLFENIKRNSLLYSYDNRERKSSLEIEINLRPNRDKMINGTSKYVRHRNCTVYDKLVKLQDMKIAAFRTFNTITSKIFCKRAL